MPQAFALEELPHPFEQELECLCEAYPEIEPLRFSDSEYLIPREDETRAVFLLLKGSCVVELPEAGGEEGAAPHLGIIEATPDAPAFLGEMAYLGDSGRSAAVRSAMSTWALRMSPQHLDRILEDFPRLTALLCRQFTQRLREANEQLQQYKSLLNLPAAHHFSGDGETLFRQGDRAEALYALVDGTMTLSGPDGVTQVHAQPGVPLLLEPGAFFGARAHRSEARAQGPAILLRIPASARVAAVRRFPEALLELVGQA